MDLILVSIWFILHDRPVGRRESRMTTKMVDYSSRDFPYKSTGQKGEEYSPGIADTLGSLSAENKVAK